MPLSDADVGQNLQRLRGNMPQADLASYMRQAGFKWSQSTVWSIEKGERPLRAIEAAHLASLLDVKLETLLRQPPNAAVLDLTSRVATARSRLRDAAMEVLRAQAELALVADRSIGSTPDRQQSLVMFELEDRFDNEIERAREAFGKKLLNEELRLGSFTMRGEYTSELFNRIIPGFKERTRGMGYFRDFTQRSDEDFDREVGALFADMVQP